MKIWDCKIILFVIALVSLAIGKETQKADSLAVKTISHQPKDAWLAQDKADHFLTSTFLTGFGYYLGKKELDYSQNQSRTFSVGFSLTFGISKEIYDGVLKRGQPSYKDLVADILGIGL